MRKWPVVLVVVFVTGAVVGFCCTELRIFPSYLPAYQLQQKELSEELAKEPMPSRRFVILAKLVTPAVVHITCHGERVVQDPFADLFEGFFGQRRRRSGVVPVTSFGSGVLVDKEGHILTNHHVIRNATKVVVKLSDRREFEAKVLGSDPKTDLALLEIGGENLPTAEMGNSDKIEVGEWVLAIGNPFGLEQTVTSGIISAKGRANVGIAEFEDFIQTDAAVNPGNSGGPLIDMDGRIVGITSAIASSTGGYQGIGFAIPINMARAVMRDIIKEGKVRRGWLGVYITDFTPQLAKDLGLTYTPGVYVEDVVAESPAAKVGLKAGDIITEVNGVDVTSATQLRSVIATTEVGTAVTLTYQRSGKEARVKPVVAAPDTSAQFKGLQTAAALGMTVVNLTRALASRYGYKGEQGVLVTKVEEDGIANQAGIEVGDLILGINNYRVSGIKEFRTLVGAVRPGRRVTIHVRSGNTIKVLVIR